MISCQLWNVEHCVDGYPDADKLAALCTDDMVFMVGPQARPTVGLEKVKAGWASMSKGPMKSAGWTVTMQIAVGDIVMNERIDRFDVGGVPVNMPVMGIFKLRDGKICEWRDAADSSMFQAQLEGKGKDYWPNSHDSLAPVTAESDAGKVVLDMCALWELDQCLSDGRPDVDRIAGCCTEDVVFSVSIGARPLVGIEAAKKGWVLPPSWKSAGWTVANQIAVGDTVMNERIDRFDIDGVLVAMPVMGVFKVRDGKISEWRDYAEGSMMQAQLTGKGKDYWPK